MNALENTLKIQPPRALGLPSWRSIALAVEVATEAGNGAPQVIGGPYDPMAWIEVRDDVDHFL